MTLKGHGEEQAQYSHFEAVNCVICNKDNSEFLFERDGFKIVKCKSCGLIYVNPRLNMKRLNEMYNKNEISPKDYYLENKESEARILERRINFIKKHKSKGKLLDVGCSIGTFLAIAKKHGFDAYGIDINKSAVEYAKNLGLNAEVKDLSSFKDKSFDIVILNDVLEHVENPIKMLKDIKRIMKEDGILEISTPNIGSILANISGKKWLHIKPNEHLYYFSPKTLAKILELSSFNLVEYKSFNRVREINVILRKLETYSKFFPKLIKVVPGFIRRIKLPIYTFDEIEVIAKIKS
ncbi:class I SAM-dependent methyltransferase [Candidatus Woesearchaeota archaeon]|nr:class I SAM-dependent methyltransferase [Candidatus Woesearchaeota archaeon]